MLAHARCLRKQSNPESSRWAKQSMFVSRFHWQSSPQPGPRPGLPPWRRPQPAHIRCARSSMSGGGRLGLSHGRSRHGLLMFPRTTHTMVLDAANGRRWPIFPASSVTTAWPSCERRPRFHLRRRGRFRHDLRPQDVPSPGQGRGRRGCRRHHLRPGQRQGLGVVRRRRGADPDFRRR